MGFFRFSRRIKILPGVSINLSKSGVSASVGPRGAKVTIGKRGVRANLGIPGTGMGYSTKITSFDDRSNDSGGSSQNEPAPYRAPRPNPTGFAPRNAPNPTAQLQLWGTRRRVCGYQGERRYRRGDQDTGIGTTV
jgi:hypothetical protein